jgi:hypothetical protein
VPSEYSPAGGTESRPEWRRRLADDLGEDPGRFLELPDAERRALRPDSLIRARVRGFRDVGRVRGWIAYERRRARELGTETRDGILRVLQEAIEVLEETEQRSWEEISELAEERRQQLAEVDHDSGEATFLNENGEEYERTGTYVSASSLVAPTEAVTDGGRNGE